MLEQNYNDRTVGQSSTGKINYLNQARKDCSTNWKEHKEKV